MKIDLFLAIGGVLIPLFMVMKLFYSYMINRSDILQNASSIKRIISESDIQDLELLVKDLSFKGTSSFHMNGFSYLDTTMSDNANQFIIEIKSFDMQKDNPEFRKKVLKHYMEVVEILHKDLVVNLKQGRFQSEIRNIKMLKGLEALSTIESSIIKDMDLGFPMQKIKKFESEG